MILELTIDSQNKDKIITYYKYDKKNLKKLLNVKKYQEKKFNLFYNELGNIDVVIKFKNENGLNTFYIKDLFILHKIWTHVSLGAKPIDAYNYEVNEGCIPIYEMDLTELVRDLNNNLNFKKIICENTVKNAFKRMERLGYKFLRKNNNQILIQRKDFENLIPIFEETNESNLILKYLLNIFLIDDEITKIKKELKNCLSKKNNKSEIDKSFCKLLNWNYNFEFIQYDKKENNIKLKKIEKNYNDKYNKITKKQKIKHELEKILYLHLNESKFSNLIEYLKEIFGESSLDNDKCNLIYYDNNDSNESLIKFNHEKEMLKQSEIKFHYNSTKDNEILIDNATKDFLYDDVEKCLDKLTDLKKYIIEVIGSTGISRNQELRTFLENDEKGYHHFKKGTKFSYQDMSATTKSLKDSGHLTSEKVDLGSKGGFNFQVFELSDMGKAIYKVMTKQNPVVPEKKAIVDQHKSLEHGYLIKDCATEFESMGYKIHQERKDLRLDLPNGKRKDFDLIIEKGNETCHIEVERGTHTDEDFFDALDKIYQVMQKEGITPAKFYFISPNEQALYGKTKRQFFLWVKQRMDGMNGAKGKIIVNFTTFGKIKKQPKNIWETIPL